MQRLARGHVGRQRARRLSQEALDRRKKQAAEAEEEARRQAAAAAAAALKEQLAREKAAVDMQRIARGRLVRAAMPARIAEAQALQQEREWLAAERARLADEGARRGPRAVATAPAIATEVSLRQAAPEPPVPPAPALDTPPPSSQEVGPDASAAALKIQAVARGRQGRRKAMGVKVQHRAAVDVQRVVRGRQSRARVAHLRSKVAGLTSPGPRDGASLADSGALEGKEGEDKEQEGNLKEEGGMERESGEVGPSMNEDQAALHIQRVARGGVARKKAARQAHARRQRELEAARRERMLEEGLS